MSALEAGMRADALVQITRSGAPLKGARGLMVGVSDEDRRRFAEAFAARGWEDDGLVLPDGRPALERAARDPAGAARAAAERPGAPTRLQAVGVCAGVMFQREAVA